MTQSEFPPSEVLYFSSYFPDFGKGIYRRAVKGMMADKVTEL